MNAARGVRHVPAVATGTVVPGSRPLGPRSLAAREAVAAVNVGALRAGVADGSITDITLTVADSHCRLAAVTLDAEFVVDEVMAGGYGACSYLFAWGVDREPLPAAAFAPLLGGYGDLVLQPDLASAFVDPAEPATWQVACAARQREGPLIAVAPRSVLEAVLAETESAGLVPSVGIEQEFTVLRPDGEAITDVGIDYALGRAEPLRPLAADARDALRAAGLGVESARAECHPGQYEIVLRHRDALAAADDALAQQAIVRRVAARHGVVASYLAAERSGHGSSCHVHVSLSDLHGRPADGDRVADPARDGARLPPVLGAFLGGVLAAAGDLTPVWAPTTNGFTRLRTARFAPRQLRWGFDDRTAAVRVVGRDRSLRIECRMPGADAQPHLVIAAIVASGLAGVRTGAIPPPEGEVVDELPATPWEALQRFTGSVRAVDLLGAGVVAHHAALVEAELSSRLDAVTDWDRRREAARS